MYRCPRIHHTTWLCADASRLPEPPKPSLAKSRFGVSAAGLERGWRLQSRWQLRYGDLCLLVACWLCWLCWLYCLYCLCWPLAGLSSTHCSFSSPGHVCGYLTLLTSLLASPPSPPSLPLSSLSLSLSLSLAPTLPLTCSKASPVQPLHSHLRLGVFWNRPPLQVNLLLDKFEVDTVSLLPSTTPATPIPAGIARILEARPTPAPL
ncbi:hypothetical protein K431DRAFT_12395 [Polychaeton citri CBS 116435]|uniref:Uncharacterized protein n=1 Tax=Polychaeton citri CBS 116435 TaxID=1314669 RepID=A0A9P4PX89_9PEZI|nr:hypothetical protein K431DRAFT_12395 [Polychaeton citri CBS 116435]